MKEQKKVKMLAWLDSPACATGFAQVARGILNYLASTGKYEISIIGINDMGDWKDPIKFPYKIFPAMPGISQRSDYYGRARLVNAVLGTDKNLKPPFDLVFTINDPFILEQPLEIFQKGTLEVLKDTQEVFKRKVPPSFWFKTVSYWPVDSAIKTNWIEKSIAMADYPVAYTKYGKEEIVKVDKHLQKPFGLDNMEVIYHGVNPKIFKPLSDEENKAFRASFFEGAVKEETFLISVIARNQSRKDLPRTLKIFSDFIRRRPNSFLYLHCQETDAGGSLKEYARNFPNLEYGKNWGCPGKFEANQGFPIEAVNAIYNASDCILSTSLGEGFGFYNSEGMATKTVVVGPNNTTTPELFGYDAKEDISDMETIYTKLRGVPVKSGSTSSEWTSFGPTDFERLRPVTNVDDAVKKLMWVYDNPDKVKEITERAYAYIQDFSWDKIGKQWDDFFQKVIVKLEEERASYVSPKKDDTTEAPKKA